MCRTEITMGQGEVDGLPGNPVQLFSGLPEDYSRVGTHDKIGPGAEEEERDEREGEGEGPLGGGRERGGD